MKTPDFMSYSRYKKQKNDNEKPKSVLLIFVATFFGMVLLFTLIAKSLSPNVDVVIGDDSETDVKESGLGVKSFVDERLKLIQMEDNSSTTAAQKTTTDKIIEQPSEEEPFSEPAYEEEAINLPSQNKTKTSDNEDATLTKAPPRPKPKEISTQPISTKITKVYVGRYATLEQAKVAQEIIIDSGINLTPFIKNLGDSYTLQVGSFTSRAKAESITADLQANGFPAKMVQE